MLSEWVGGCSGIRTANLQTPQTRDSVIAHSKIEFRFLTNGIIGQTETFPQIIAQPGYANVLVAMQSEDGNEYLVAVVGYPHPIDNPPLPATRKWTSGGAQPN